jgi:hypothetical protein
MTLSDLHLKAPGLTTFMTLEVVLTVDSQADGIGAVSCQQSHIFSSLVLLDLMVILSNGIIRYYL